MIFSQKRRFLRDCRAFHIPLSIQGGGCLEIQGPWPAKHILLFLSRDAFLQDEALTERMSAHFLARGMTVVKYFTAAMLIQREIGPAWVYRWPRKIRPGLKGLNLLRTPRNWWYFFPHQKAKVHAIPFRVEGLRALMAEWKVDCPVTLFARSAGGRTATMAADEIGAHRVICIGYPFKHPAEPDDRARYAHLSSVTTPLLILQGVRDEYGGAEILTKYQFGPNTQIELVDTNHNFDLPEDRWTQVLARMDAFIA